MPRTAREYLESEVNRLVSQARDVTRKAEEENRGLNDDERMKVEGLIAETNHVKSRITEQDDNDRLLQAIEDVSASPTGEPTVADAPAKTLGEAFTKSPAYQALMKRGLVGSWTSGPIDFGQKLNDAEGNRVSAEQGSPIFGGGTNTLEPQILPGIQGPIEQRLTVADLLGQGQTNTNAIVYLKETLTVNGAVTSGANSSAVLTSEGGVKPASQLDFNKVTTAVDKIATFLPISDEMLEDQPQVATYINGRLQLFVRQAEEEYIVAKLLAVAGTASSAAEVDGTNIFDGIAAAIMHVRVDSGLEPDGAADLPARRGEDGRGSCNRRHRRVLQRRALRPAEPEPVGTASRGHHGRQQRWIGCRCVPRGRDAVASWRTDDRGKQLARGLLPSQLDGAALRRAARDHRVP
jgi:HK97 family phage major capsid protein